LQCRIKINLRKDVNAMKPLSTSRKILLCVMTISIILIMGIIIILIGGNTPAKRYEQYLSLGDKYLTELNYEKAIVAYTKAIEIEPRNMAAYLNLAEAYASTRDDRNVGRTYQDAFNVLWGMYKTNEAMPEGATELLTEYIAYLKKNGDYDKAERVMEQSFLMTLDDRFIERRDSDDMANLDGADMANPDEDDMENLDEDDMANLGDDGLPIDEELDTGAPKNAVDVKLTKASEELLEDEVYVNDSITLTAAKSYDGSYARGHYALDNDTELIPDMLRLVSLTPDIARANGLTLTALSEGVARFIVKSYWYDDNGNEIAGVQSKEYELKVTHFKPKRQLYVDIQQVDSSGFPKVSIYASIKDEYGNIVEDIDKDMFSVQEDDTKGNIYLSKIEDMYRILKREGLNINLVLDQSGSMSDYDAMNKAKEAAITFLGIVESYGNPDKIEIMSFDDYVYLRQPFTSNFRDLVSAVNDIYPNGMTAIYDAICSAIIRTNNQSGAKCVIMFTDGMENASSYSYQDTVDLARTTNVPVYVIGVGYDIDEGMLKRLASDTNGKYYSANTSDLNTALADIYFDIYTEKQDMYTIKYTSNFVNMKNDYRKLILSIVENKVYNSAEIEHRYIPEPIVNESFGAFRYMDYILPHSSTTAVSDGDLYGLSLAELRIARNEIYARHGRQFRDSLLNQWFYSKTWYLQIPLKYSPAAFDAGIPGNTLTTLEMNNANYILKYEQNLMANSYIFPNCLTTALTEYDVSLTKAVLSRGLSELYAMAGVREGEINRLSGIAKQNAELITRAIERSDISY